MNKNFIEDTFPEDISFGALGGPEFKTEIVSSISGIEHRNIKWGHARAKYNVSYGIKTKEQIDEILSFFRARKGRAVGFRFKDWCDYKAENELIATGDGDTKIFQLIKNYKSGDGYYVRVITKPVINTIKIYTHNKIFSSEEYEIDYTCGKIKFLNAPIKNMRIFADFEFDVPVRFDSDYLPISIDDHDIYSCNNINLIEIKISQ